MLIKDTRILVLLFVLWNVNWLEPTGSWAWCMEGGWLWEHWVYFPARGDDCYRGNYVTCVLKDEF